MKLARVTQITIWQYGNSDQTFDTVLPFLQDDSLISAEGYSDDFLCNTYTNNPNFSIRSNATFL